MKNTYTKTFILSIFALQIITVENIAYSSSFCHTVKQGDTLYSIAKSSNISLAELKSFNDDALSGNLMIGDLISTGWKYSCSNVKDANISSDFKKDYIIVLEGDSLYGIAKRFDVSVNEIIEMNSLEPPYTINIGDKIYYNSDKRGYKVESNQRNDLKEMNVAFNSTPVIKKSDFISPVSGKIISKFNISSYGQINKGINISGKEGVAIKASNDGIVIYSGDRLSGFGNTVIIQHKDNYKTIYSHNKSNLVFKNEAIKKGDKIATLGLSGKVKSPQLHFEVRKGSIPINPENLIK